MQPLMWRWVNDKTDRFRGDSTKCKLWQYLGDVDDFVQLHEEPVARIINLSELLLGDTDPCWHWDKMETKHWLTKAKQTGQKQFIRAIYDSLTFEISFM